MKRIEVVFFDAGGGHRSAANALKHVIEQQNRDWEVKLVNLQELLAPLDIFRKVTGVSAENVYNEVLKRGWTLGSPQVARVMQTIIRFYHPRQVALLEKHWVATRPDLLVSLIPNFNRALHQSLKHSMPGTPMVTILTDMADYPPHFWMEQQEQGFICGTERAVAQAHSLGHEPSRVFRTSGMILNPRFYDFVSLDRRAERARLGLNPDLPTGLVLFGGHGSGVMYRIAERLGKAGLKVQLILLCGHNAKLAARLRALKTSMPVHVEDFTREVPRFMSLADFFIGKPGPGSISEALAMKLPVIVERNAWTMPQERYNTEWVREQGAGLVLKSFRDIVGAVQELLEPSNYERFRSAAAAQANRAVFEIPDMLEKLLNGCGEMPAQAAARARKN
ncbi:MAG: galactosyldiacylglycerol synthase [Acidobacteriota bacterium]|nr:galactosyldiacylglycerol synthase [Acidobacteriota bacterium]